MKNIIRKIFEFIKKIMPLIIIIAIICIIKFHPKFLTIIDFLGITNKQEDVSNLISYIELFIECGFLYFVLKEFKMTRKSFEWQQKEIQEKKDKEANRQLNDIIRYFLKEYYHFWVRNYVEIVLLNEERKCREWTEEEFDEKYSQCSCPDENEKVNCLINEYKKKSNGEIIIVDDKEEEIIKKIIEKFVIYVSEIQGFADKTVVYRRNTKKRKQIVLEGDEFIKNYVIKPELVKTLNIDYKILEKIYYHCLYGKYFN